MLRVGLLILLMALAGSLAADHDSDSKLSWHLLSAGLDESRLSVHRQEALVGIFNLPCDLTGIGSAQSEDGIDIAVVDIPARPQGLLVIRCNVGAHAQMLSIIDPSNKSTAPAWQRSGSFFARWEIEDDELWLEYDRACETGVSIECPDGFETRFESYPAAAE